MKVAVYYNNRDIRIEEMPLPEIGDGELLVKVMASGICGSDVMEWYRIKKAPRVLGHEITGEVVRVGKGVERYKIGDRVFVSHHVPCNICHYCLQGNYTVCDTLRNTNFYPGGFSEYIRVPRINVDRGVFILPENVGFDEGTFIEPLGCCVRGMRLVRFRPGWSVVILGSGIAGLLNIALAKALGASSILSTDINDYRLRKAEEIGADLSLHPREDLPAKLRELNRGRLADLVIVATDAKEVFNQALNLVDRGGTILLFAPPQPGTELSIPGFPFWREQIRLISTYAAAPEDIEVAIELIASKRVEVESMITHKLPLEDAPLGFRLVAEAGESIKVIIKPQGME